MTNWLLLLHLFWWWWGSGSEPDTCSVAWYTRQYPPAVIQQCNTAAAVSGLTAAEKEVVLITNLVRYNPALFAQKVLRPYIQQCDRSLLLDSNSVYVQSLFKDLRQTKPMQLLQVEPVLNGTAASHAEYCSRTGHIGHDNMLERWQIIRRELEHISAGENCSYVPSGKNSALHHVISLLVDDGWPSYGHRYAILNKSYQYIGVAIRPFPDDRYCMVQNFSTPKLVNN